jgi:hypothetical protein
MNCRSVTSLVKPTLLILSGVVLLLSITGATNAKPTTNLRSNLRPSGSDANFINMKAARRILVHVISRKGKAISKRAVRLPAACSCAVAPDELDGFGSCFGNCLRGWGVSYGSLITCGGICALAATGNPVGIGVCAACVGTAEWIVAGCAMNCMYSGRYGLLEEARSRRARRHGLQQAKIILKRVTLG